MILVDRKPTPRLFALFPVGRKLSAFFYAPFSSRRALVLLPARYLGRIFSLELPITLCAQGPLAYIFYQAQCLLDFMDYLTAAVFLLVKVQTAPLHFADLSGASGCDGALSQGSQRGCGIASALGTSHSMGHVAYHRWLYRHWSPMAAPRRA